MEKKTPRPRAKKLRLDEFLVGHGHTYQIWLNGAEIRGLITYINEHNAEHREQQIERVNDLLQDIVRDWVRRHNQEYLEKAIRELDA